MKHIVNFSGGKDSTAMLIRMIEEGMPIDDIVFIKVMATDEIGADYPEMYDYIEKVEDYIGRKITIVPSILTFDEFFIQDIKPVNVQEQCMVFPSQSVPGAMTV